MIMSWHTLELLVGVVGQESRDIRLTIRRWLTEKGQQWWRTIANGVGSNVPTVAGADI